MHLREFRFQILDFMFRVALSLKHFYSGVLVLFSEEGDCLLEMNLLFVDFCVKVLYLSASSIKILF